MRVRRSTGEQIGTLSAGEGEAWTNDSGKSNRLIKVDGTTIKMEVFMFFNLLIATARVVATESNPVPLGRALPARVLTRRASPSKIQIGSRFVCRPSENTGKPEDLLNYGSILLAKRSQSGSISHWRC